MILVTGPTGQVGQPLVDLLVAGGHRVRALVEPDVPSPWPPKGPVETFVGDLGDSEAVARAAAGTSRVFMLVPPSPLQPLWQRTVLAAARGSEQVVKLSAYNTAPDSPLTLGRWHTEGEDELRRSGTPSVMLRPQYFLQNLLHDRAALLAGRLRTFLPPTVRVGMVDAHDVAAVAAAVLTAPVEADRVLVPTGPAAVTTADIARAIAAAVGRPIHVDYLPPARARAALLTAGRAEWHADDTVALCQTASAEVTDCVPALLGRPARTVADVVARHLASPSSRGSSAREAVRP